MLMRAKMRITDVDKSHKGQELISMTAVCKSESYPEDGSDENNTFAMFTPAANLSMNINNPALHGKIEVDQEFYLDFTLVPK